MLCERYSVVTETTGIKGFVAQQVRLLQTLKIVHLKSNTMRRKSQEFAEYTKSDGSISVMRKYQKECVDALFGGMSIEEIESFIERKMLPKGQHAMLYEDKHIEHFLERVQQLLITTKYKIDISLR